MGFEQQYDKNFTYQGVVELCHNHYEEIVERKPLQHLLDNKEVRFINPMGQFDYTCFGNFYFDSMGVMMLITSDPTYTPYHRPDRMSNTLWSAVPVLFAGIDTGCKDNRGNRIFTDDLCSYKMYCLLVGYIPSREEPVLIADNHYVPLSVAYQEGKLIKEGSPYYCMSKQMFEIYDPDCSSKDFVQYLHGHSTMDELREKARTANERPTFADGLPDLMGKSHIRTYSEISEMLDKEITLVCIADTEITQDYDEKNDDFVDSRMVYSTNIPDKIMGELFWIHIDTGNGDKSLREAFDYFMINAHRHPEKLYVLADFDVSALYGSNYKHSIAMTFYPLAKYHIPNVVLPYWIVDEWIMDPHFIDCTN